MLVFLYLFLGSSVLNFIYFIFFLKFSLKSSSGTTTTFSQPVSVIIYSKNQADYLRQVLPQFQNQSYPEFELILINDASIDETLDVMEAFQQTDSRIGIVNVQNNEAFWGNKKYALTLGIKKARYAHLLFTRADTQPDSENWIREMSASFASGKSIVIGYSGFQKTKGSLFNKMMRFDGLLGAIECFSQALWNNPYSGTGRNLGYTTDHFYRINGFARHLHISGGEDMLFINEASDGQNTAVCYTEDALLRHAPPKTFSEWFYQKRREWFIAHNFKLKHRILLGTFKVSQMLFWLFFFTLVVGPYWMWAASVLAVRLLLQAVVYYGAAKKLKETDVIWMFPLMELFLVCIQIGIFMSNIFSKPTHWK